MSLLKLNGFRIQCRNQQSQVFPLIVINEASYEIFSYLSRQPVYPHVVMTYYNMQYIMQSHNCLHTYMPLQYYLTRAHIQHALHSFVYCYLYFDPFSLQIFYDNHQHHILSHIVLVRFCNMLENQFLYILQIDISYDHKFVHHFLPVVSWIELYYYYELHFPSVIPYVYHCVQD